MVAEEATIRRLLGTLKAVDGQPALARTVRGWRGCVTVYPSWYDHTIYANTLLDVVRRTA